MAYHVSADGLELFEAIEHYLDQDDFARVQDAHAFARHAHGDQRRKSGELFFTHPVTVAYELSRYQLDADSLIAALLHDVAEDTRVSIEEIRTNFGPRVAQIVEGMTKFQQREEDIAAGGELSRQQRTNATLAKLFRFMIRDVRVVMIKLYDRLHNMQTLDSMPPEKQKQIAQQTLDIYAPLANRLGMWALKTELENLSLSYVDPEAYRYITHALNSLFERQQPLLDKLRDALCRQLDDEGVRYMRIEPSPRSIYSIYRQSAAVGLKRAIDQTPRIVVVVPDRRTCYEALGAIHVMWHPVPGKFDDYIANPRDNMYRALHTTVITEEGLTVKVRFRSEAMYMMSELGILANFARHHRQLESWEFTNELTEQINALLDSIGQNIATDPQDPETSVRGVVEDVLGEQIIVFTPRGETRDLPKGATPIDFAFTIHSDVGLGAHRAEVNDEIVPLNTPLNDTDRVRLITRGKTPRRTWLDEDLGFLHTSRARSLTRRWFRRLPEAQAIAEGRALVRKELALIGQSHYDHADVADILGFSSAEALYLALGRAETLPTDLATKVLTHSWVVHETRHIGRVAVDENGEQFVILHAGERELRLCRTCQPQVGEPIVGFIRRDDGVTVHRDNCRLLPPEARERTMRLQWGLDGTQQVHTVPIEIDVYDRTQLLYEITDMLRREDINIADIHTSKIGRDIRIYLALDVTSPRQLVRILHRVTALVNVYAVRCLPQPKRFDDLYASFGTNGMYF